MQLTEEDWKAMKEELEESLFPTNRRPPMNCFRTYLRMMRRHYGFSIRTLDHANWYAHESSFIYLLYC